MSDIVPQTHDERVALARRLSIIDPRAAAMVLKVPTIPKDFLMTFKFAEGVAGAQDEQLLITKSRCDYLVLELEYTIRRPLFLAGETDRYRQEVAFQQIPYLGLVLLIDGCPEYSVTDQVEPLELIARPSTLPSQCGKCRPFTLFDTDTLRGRMRIDRDLSTDLGEFPFTATIVTHGLLMQCNRFDDMTVDLACAYLMKEHNIHVNQALLPEYIRDVARAER